MVSFLRDKLHAVNIIQLKLKVHDTYKKDEKPTTNFEPTDDSDVINKGYLDEKLKKINSHFSYFEKITTNLNHKITNNL